MAIHTHGSCDHKSKSIWAGLQSPVVLSNSGSGKVMAAEIPGLYLACAQTKLQTKRDIIQMLSPALYFWLSTFLHFSILFFSSPLDLFLSEICMRACAEQTWGVNSRNQRKPSVRNKRWICLLLSIFCFIPLLVSLCEPAGLGEVSDLRTQRIPWQKSTLTDGRHTETDFGFGCSSGISRKFLGLVSDCILLFRSYLIRKGL